MSKLDVDLAEIEDFIQNFAPDSPDFREPALRTQIKSSYKQLHALLVWGLVAEKSTNLSGSTKLYFTECLSDISHAYFLNLFSLYKSSRSSLRSAVENFIRVLLMHKGADVSSIKSMYDLFARAKSEYSGDIQAQKFVTRLQELYGELCKSVHTTSLDYFSLSIPFAKLSFFEQRDFSANNKLLREVSSVLNQCAFWIWDQYLSLVGHQNADLVRDAVPRGVKKAKSE